MPEDASDSKPEHAKKKKKGHTARLRRKRNLHKLAWQVVDHLPCKFSEWRKTPEHWLKLVEAACHEVELPPAYIMSKLSKAIGFESHKMADWLSGRTAEGGLVEATWADFRAAFLSFYPGLPPSVTRDTWTALSQANCKSYHKFVEQFQQQAEELQAGESEKIHYFKRGLRTSIRNHVEIDPVTTAEWASFAKLRDAATGYANAELTAAIDDTAGRPQRPSRMKRRAEDRSGGQRKRRNYSDADKARQIALTKYHRQKGLCDLCHEEGHLKKDCPDPGKNPGWKPPSSFKITDYVENRRPSSKPRDVQKKRHFPK